MEEYMLNISPIDGRYREMTEEVRSYFSEYHLIKSRVIVEIEWMKKLFSIKDFNVKINKEKIKLLDSIVEKFDINEAKKVKEIEKTTKHDVKAVEYYIDEKLKENGMERYNYLVHFACTSEDINNIAYGIMVKELIDKVYIKNLKLLIEKIMEKSKKKTY